MLKRLRIVPHDHFRHLPIGEDPVPGTEEAMNPEEDYPPPLGTIPLEAAESNGYGRTVWEWMHGCIEDENDSMDVEPE